MVDSFPLSSDSHATSWMGGNSATGSKKQPQETMIVFVHDSSGPSEALAENQREVWKHVAVFV